MESSTSTSLANADTWCFVSGMIQHVNQTHDLNIKCVKLECSEKWLAKFIQLKILRIIQDSGASHAVEILGSNAVKVKMQGQNLTLIRISDDDLTGQKFTVLLSYEIVCMLCERHSITVHQGVQELSILESATQRIAFESFNVKDLFEYKAQYFQRRCTKLESATKEMSNLVLQTTASLAIAERKVQMLKVVLIGMALNSFRMISENQILARQNAAFREMIATLNWQIASNAVIEIEIGSEPSQPNSTRSSINYEDVD